MLFTFLASVTVCAVELFFVFLECMPNVYFDHIWAFSTPTVCFSQSDLSHAVVNLCSVSDRLCCKTISASFTLYVNSLFLTIFGHYPRPLLCVSGWVVYLIMQFTFPTAGAHCATELFLFLSGCMSKSLFWPYLGIPAAHWFCGFCCVTSVIL